MNYLDFELPIKELEDQLNDCKIIGEKSDVDVSETYEQIENKLKQTKKDIYSNLTPWQRVQMSRHPDRPYTLDYITAIFGDSFWKTCLQFFQFYFHESNHHYLKKILYHPYLFQLLF